MDQKIILGGARYVKSGPRKGVVIRSPEGEALERWQDGKFLAVEREFAQRWRRALSEIDLARTRATLLGQERVRDLAGAKRAAEEMVRRDGERYGILRMALDRLGVPGALRGEIIRRWKNEGGPRLVDFAAYAAYVHTVDMFFSLATGAGLESVERPSHKVDLAYLYYLPFCNVFSSGDRFHARVAPLFLTGEQVFVSAAELKADLAKLDEHYSKLPDEVKAQGIMQFAFYPPEEGDFLVSRLWDRFMARDWRERARGKGKRVKRSEEQQRKFVEHMNRLEAEGNPSEPFSLEEATEAVIKRRVPPQRGKWRLLSEEIVKRGQSESDGDRS